MAGSPPRPVGSPRMAPPSADAAATGGFFGIWAGVGAGAGDSGPPPSPVLAPAPRAPRARRYKTESRRVKYAKEKGHRETVKNEFDKLSSELEAKKEVRISQKIVTMQMRLQ